MYSPEETAERLGCKVGVITYKPMSELLTNPKAHAFMNTLEVNGHVSSPLTRKNLTNLYGVSARSQRYYSVALGINETPNHLVEVVCRSYGEALDEVRRRGGLGKYRASCQPIHDAERLIFQGAVVLRQIGNSRPTDIYSETGELVRVGNSNGSGIWATRELRHILQTHPRSTGVLVRCEGTEHLSIAPEATEDFMDTLCGFLAEGSEAFDEVMRTVRTHQVPIVPYDHDVHVQPHQNNSDIGWFTIDNFL